MKVKEVKAFVRRSRIDAVVCELRSMGIKSLSVIAVEGVGALADPADDSLSLEYVTRFSKVYKVELLCQEKDVDEVVALIQKTAHTGEAGDGLIFISSVERVLKIRSGKEGHAAIEKPQRPSTS